MFACCLFRFGALHLKMIALNFPPIIAPTAATPLLCTALPSCNIQNCFISFTQQLQWGFFCLLLFPHRIWSPGCDLLTKCIKHLGRKKKKGKKGVVLDWRCCDDLYHLTLIIHSRAVVVGVASTIIWSLIPSAVPERNTFLWVKVWEM